MEKNEKMGEKQKQQNKGWKNKRLGTKQGSKTNEAEVKKRLKK